MSVATRTPRDRRDSSRVSDLAWQLEFWDPVEWQPRVVARRIWCKLTATRRRKWVTWSLIVVFVFGVLPVLVSAVAAAAGEGESQGTGGNSVLGFTGVRDSSGVALSDYIFATNHGSILHPGNTGLSIGIGILFGFFMVVVILPPWIVGWVLGFGWMDSFSGPLNGVAHALTGQLATTIMFITCATIGALFVAVFVQQGHYAKATMQGVAMLLIAVLGPMFLSDPLGEVLSSHGMLAQGRDVGLSVSAGLNGNSNPNPSQMVVSLQEDMADNFARHPVQVWNFGHVVDDRPGCGAAWSAGVRAGSEDKIKDGMKSCGDSAAYASANNPSFGQIGSGFVLLFTALILLAFAVYMAIKIIWSALDSVYWGLATIFGFAGGALIYGATQTFTIRAVVHGLMSAVRMCLQIIALAVYLLFFGDLFKQAKGHEMSIFVIGAIAMMVFMAQYKRLSDTLERANDSAANRLALIAQGATAAGGRGGGGGRALGMGEMGAAHKMNSGMMLAALGGASTIVNSPITEWALGAIPGVGRPQALKKKRITENSAAISSMQVPFWADPEMGGAMGAYKESYMKWPYYNDLARRWSNADHVDGGVGSARGAASAMLALDKRGDVGVGDSMATLEMAGWDRNTVRHAGQVYGLMNSLAKSNPLADGHLAGIMAAQNLAENSLLRINHVGGRRPHEGEEDHLEAAVYALRARASHYRENMLPGGVTLRDGRNALNNEKYYADHLIAIKDDYLANPTEAKMRALEKASRGDSRDMADAFDRNLGTLNIPYTSLERDPAARLMKHIANDEAGKLVEATDALAMNSTTMLDEDLHHWVRHFSNRRINTENWSSNSNRAVTHPAPPEFRP